MTKVSPVSLAAAYQLQTVQIGLTIPLVTLTTLSAVLAQKAYMLFYVKRSLAFAPPPSHFLASTSNGISSGSSGLPHATGIPIPGVASQTPGGKSGHPIRGMAV